MNAFRDASWVVLSGVMLCCGGQAIGLRPDAGASGDGSSAASAVPPASAVPQGSGSNSADADADAAGDAAVVADEGRMAPMELTTQSTVWVGEVDPTATYAESLDSKGPQRVLLILGPIKDSIVGTVTFDSASPPPSPRDPTQVYPPTPANPDGGTYSVISDNWMTRPYPGFVYSLVSSAVQGNHILSAFVPAELWRDWCAIQVPTAAGSPSARCQCDTKTCRSVSAPTRRLDLVVNGDAMQGELAQPYGPWLTSPAIIRLKRIQ
jgi:hypothetical protein